MISKEKKPRILHIDNDISFTGLFKVTFSEWLNIKPVHDGNRALEILNEENFDAVVTDYYLPGFNGIDLLKLIKSKCPKTPVIFCTDRGNEGIARSAFINGASDYFTKELDSLAGKEEILNSLLSNIEKNKTDTDLKDSEELYPALVETSMDKREQRYKAFFDYSGIGILLFDQKGEILNTNSNLTDMMGYSKEELKSLTLKEIIHPGDYKKGLEYLFKEQNEDHTRTLDTENRFITKNGKIVWGRLIIRIIEDTNKNFLYYLGMIKNINIQKKAREEYDNLFKLSLDNLCIAGFDGYFKQINPSWTKTLGWSEEELYSKMWLDFVHPDDQEKTRKIGEVLAKGKEIVGFENRYLCKDGSYKWLSWNSFPDTENKRIFAVARDVTENKKNELENELIRKELTREKSLLKKIMDTSPVGITTVDRHGNIVFANKEAEKVLGLSKNNIKGLSYNAPQWKITDCEGNPLPDKALPFFQIKKTGNPIFEFQHAIEWPDGQRVFLSINATPLFDESGEFGGMVGIVQNITEKIRKEKELHLSELKYRTIFETTGSAMLIIEDDMTISLVNRQFENLTGYSKDTIENKTKWTKLVEPGYLEIMKKYHRKRRESFSSVPKTYEFQLIDSQGKVKDILINILLIPGTKKSVASFQDITSLKKMEYSLMEKNRELFDYAYMVSHDLKNPLSLIIGFMSAIIEEPELFDQYSKKILDVSYQMSNLIDNILKLSRAGKVKESCSRIDLDILTANIYKEFQRPEIASKLTTNFSQQYIMGDYQRIEQVFRNLFQNSFRYRNKENNTLIIEIESKKEFGCSIITFKDNGSGIDQKDIEKLFKPGFTRGQGTGFGLAIVRKVIDAHDGSISVYSEGKNKGATFTIKLPL